MRSLICLFVLLSAPAFARDQIFPSDLEYGLHVTLTAPKERKLPTAPLSVEPLVVAFTQEPVAVLSSAKLEPGQSVVGRKPLPKGTRYSIWYRPLGGTAWNGAPREFKLVGGEIDRQLVKVDLRMRRIDVHHVSISRPDGTTYQVVGNVTVKTPPGKDGRDVLSFATGQGVDVPPGLVYEVRVAAKSASGPLEYVKELDFSQID